MGERNKHIENLRKGNRSSFEYLYTVWSGKLYNFVMKISHGIGGIVCLVYKFFAFLRAFVVLKNQRILLGDDILRPRPYLWHKEFRGGLFVVLYRESPSFYVGNG